MSGVRGEVRVIAGLQLRVCTKEGGLSDQGLEQLKLNKNLVMLTSKQYNLLCTLGGISC